MRIIPQEERETSIKAWWKCQICGAGEEGTTMRMLMLGSLHAAETGHVVDAEVCTHSVYTPSLETVEAHSEKAVAWAERKSAREAAAARKAAGIDGRKNRKKAPERGLAIPETELRRHIIQTVKDADDGGKPVHSKNALIELLKVKDVRVARSVVLKTVDAMVADGHLKHGRPTYNKRGHVLKVGSITDFVRWEHEHEHEHSEDIAARE